MIEALDVLPSSVETKFALKSLSHQHTVEKKAFRNCKEIGLGIFRKTGYNIIHREKRSQQMLLYCVAMTAIRQHLKWPWKSHCVTGEGYRQPKHRLSFHLPLRKKRRKAKVTKHGLVSIFSVLRKVIKSFLWEYIHRHKRKRSLLRMASTLLERATHGRPSWWVQWAS